MTEKPQPVDAFILELKDRYNVSTSYIKKVAKTYADGTSASHICIANYGPFRSAELQDKLTILPMRDKAVLLVDHFRPDNVHPAVTEALSTAVRAALPEQDYALIVDVSGSVEGIDVPSQVQAIVSRLGQPRKAFTFRDKLAEASVPFNEEELAAGGRN